MGLSSSSQWASWHDTDPQPHRQPASLSPPVSPTSSSPLTFVERAMASDHHRSQSLCIFCGTSAPFTREKHKPMQLAFTEHTAQLMHVLVHEQRLGLAELHGLGNACAHPRSPRPPVTPLHSV